MDTLRPVAADEQLIAQGEYNYQVAGKDCGLQESWTLHRLPDGEIIHRAQVGGFIAGTNIKQITHFLTLPDYQPRLLEMTQDINGQLARTQLECSEATIRQSITTENYDEAVSENTTTITEIAAPPGYRLFLPPVSAQGLIVEGYNFANGGKQVIPLVSIRIQPEDALPLSVDVQSIEYEYIEDFGVETPAGQFNCRHFIRYDQHMQQQLWIDENWITVQWSVPYSEIMKWEYLLTRYQRA